MDINRLVIIGRMTNDPELKYTNSGTAVTKFSIASNGFKDKDGKEKADFFDCVLWGKAAESLTPYLSKGKRVGIDGRLQQDRWTADDGQKRSRVSINIERLEFLDSKKKEDDQGGHNEPDPNFYDDPGPEEPNF